MAAFFDQPFPLRPRGTVVAPTRISFQASSQGTTSSATSASTLDAQSHQEQVLLTTFGLPTQGTYEFIPTKSLPAGASISGPFIDAGQFTSFPTMNYLKGIRVPRFARLYIVEEFKHLSNTANHHVPRTPADEWGYYLRCSILKHFSYNKYCTPLKAGPHRMEQRAAYSKFMSDFLDAVSSTNGRRIETDERKAELVHLEQDLTQKTFHCYPVLFHQTFQANETLLQGLEDTATDNVEPGNAPNTRAFVEGLRDKLWREWIDVGDPLDISNGLDEIYDKYGDLEKRYHDLLQHMESRIHALLNSDEDDNNDDDILAIYEQTDADGNFRIHEDLVLADNYTRMDGIAMMRHYRALRPMDVQTRVERFWTQERAPGIENVGALAPVIRRPAPEVAPEVGDMGIQVLGIGHGRPRWTAVYR
ncbi:hypothetical protein N7G274_006349 [Stereocaulon virgatum]|uniref:Uncharacterized protein n=1 Tax=Stereocaulon virgatum TaxID=373712 RepID=A0ABR4A7K3_9LECA